MKKTLSIGALGCVLLFILFGAWNDWSLNRIGPTANKNDSSQLGENSSKFSVATASVSAADKTLSSPLKSWAQGELITYRPGDQRAIKKYTGQLRSDGSIERDAPGWWLYAHSREEADWLDRFGYPTPSEEIALAKMSDEGLAGMVARGDLNAKAHQVARFAKQVLLDDKSDKNKNDHSAGEVSELIARGGPYQAIAMVKAHADLLEIFANLPEKERTPSRKAFLKRLDVELESATDMALAGGDHTVRSLYGAGVRTRLKQFDLANTEQRSAGQFAQSLNAISKARQELNLPPITLIPRPEPTGNVMYERF